MKRYILLAAILIYGLNAYSQSWDLVNPRPAIYQLNNLEFVNGHVGYAIGNYGVLLKTIDAGETWHKQEFYNDQFLWSIQYLNSDTGWIYGRKTEFSQRKLYYTSNGGVNYSIILLPPSSNVWGISVFGLNNILISNNSGSPSQGTILKSADAGISWLPVLNVNLGFNTGCIEMVNLNIGFAVAVSSDSSKIYKTTDAGDSWVQIFSIDKRINSINFKDALNGCCSGNAGTIILTTDGGITWNNVSAGILGDLGSLNRYKNYYSCQSSNGSIVKSNDGGLTWTQYTINSNFSMVNIHAIDSVNFCALGDYQSIILRSIDSGSTW
jgi:photosystem II stability/assembly factor-like uncharacterized protein